MTSNFLLPVDGMLGLTDMKTHRMIINTLQNTISYSSKIISGMDELVPLATMLNTVSSSEQTQETTNDLHHTTVGVYSEDKIDITRALKNTKVTVCGDYEVPDLVVIKVRISLPDVSILSHICLKESTSIKRLSTEPTLSTFQEGQGTVALLVNTTGSPI